MFSLAEKLNYEWFVLFISNNLLQILSNDLLIVLKNKKKLVLTSIMLSPV